MAGFVYFIPEMNDVTADGLAGLGLGYIGRGGGRRKTFSGPGGKAGVLVGGPGCSSSDIIYKPEHTWKQIPGSVAWIGCVELPKPIDLARDHQLAGYPRVMGDGQEWIIPIAHSWQWNEDTGSVEGFATLPRISSVDSEGNWQRTAIVRKYRQLWKFTEDWFAVWAGSKDPQQIDFACEEDACLCALQTNYHIGQMELDEGFLELLNDETRGLILRALVDMDAYERITTEEKKTDNESSLTGSTRPTCNIDAGEAA